MPHCKAKRKSRFYRGLFNKNRKNEQKKEKIEKWTDFHKRWTLISDEQVSFCRAVRQSKA